MHGPTGVRRKVALGFALSLALVSTAQASKIVLEMGRILQGELARLPSVANYKAPPPADGAPVPRLIVMCDDGLRRYFVPTRRVSEVLEAEEETQERFYIHQPPQVKGGRVGNVGPILKITPFDEHGRRIFTMATEKGPVNVIQGITVITPNWTQVDGLNYHWEMRIATSSIPFETLKRVLERASNTRLGNVVSNPPEPDKGVTVSATGNAKKVDPRSSDRRLKLARLYIQMERYGEARPELKQIIEDFPDLAKQVEPFERSLTQLHARRILDEIRVRADAGEHQLAYQMLRQFPIEGAGGEILQSVRGMREDYENENNRAIAARKLFDELLASLPEDDRRRVLPARDEIFARRSQMEPEEVSDWLTFGSTLGQQTLDVDNVAAAKPQVLPSPGRRIVELFAEDARQAVIIIARTGRLETNQQRLLFDALRTVMKRPDLYNEEDFAAVVLGDEVQQLLKRDPKKLGPEEVLRLNRLLLESAYPQLIVKSQFTGLTMNTLVHLEAFLQFADQKNLAQGDKPLTADEKLSLAVSGWVLGSNSATPKLPVALSLWKARTLVREYLREPMKLKRDQLLEDIRAQEGTSPDAIAKLLANLPPPIDTPPQFVSGFFELEVPATGNAPPAKYFVQLPPEYDPQGRYPTVVGLHGLGTVAAHSVIFPPGPEDAKKPSLIDWWAGTPDADGIRRGQSMRHGYIVIAPAWTRPAQKEYEYTGGEHEAVLSALRDACRRFAIDTDRVFLSGHSMGGDAAWDMGLAHPDLWAGVIPIVGLSDKYCGLYFENARYVPYYVIGGELDGDNAIRNGRDIDRFMARGFDVTVAEFLGRGHEHFSDEILNVFDWMKRRKRDFHNKDFAVKTIRPGDNFFWWVELNDFPDKAVANAWPPKGKRPLEVECRITSTTGLMASNTVRVTSGAGRTTIWLSPQLLDFERKTIVYVDGRRINPTPYVKPDIAVILEDARTRGDRQHPYWARLDSF